MPTPPRKGSAVSVQGLSDFVKELKGLEGGMDNRKELAKAHRAVAVKVAAWAKLAARTRAERKGSRFIKGTGTAYGASITVAKRANPVFWGAKRHFGWYADPRFDRSPAQFPAWVGQKWDVGVSGQGPYVINDTIASHLKQIEEMFGQAVDDAMHRAFPDK